MIADLSVLLVHRKDGERAQLRAAFEALEGVEIAGERSDLRAGMMMARQIKPAILVLEMNGNADDVLSAAAAYRLEHPEGAIFLSTDQLNPEMLVRAMRAGAQEILRAPLDRSALGAAVDRVAAVTAHKHGTKRRRTVVTVYSNKGGVGVSTLATNLAVSVARQTRREVALADFAQGAAVASMMGLTPSRTLANLAADGRVDSASVYDAITRHRSGVGVLAQPEQVEQDEVVTAEQAGSVLEVLSSTYEDVVVDAPHTFSDVALELFERSSTVLLVTELNVQALRSARRALDVFQRLNYLVTPDRVRILVNRHLERSPITCEQAESTLGTAVFHQIGNDYAAVNEALNLGLPLCLETPVSRAGRDIDALARMLFPVEAVAVPSDVAPARRQLLKLFGKG